MMLQISLPQFFSTGSESCFMFIFGPNHCLDQYVNEYTLLCIFNADLTILGMFSLAIAFSKTRLVLAPKQASDGR